VKPHNVRKSEARALSFWVFVALAILLLVYAAIERVPGVDGVLLGGLITWAASWYYYRRAGQELTAETAKIRRLNVLMLLGMEHAGWIELSRDHAREITGFHLRIQTHGIPSGEVGTPMLIRHDPPQPPSQESSSKEPPTP